jgi:hypothetical protein
MKPAYHIPLTPKELQTLGELCAIQGQIEKLMQDTVALLLEVGDQLGKAIMGSSSMEANSLIWITTVRQRVKDETARAWAEIAYRELKDLAAGRNDFVHAAYGQNLGESARIQMFGFSISTGPMVIAKGRGSMAMRVKSGKRRPVSDLQDVRDKAARLSNIFAAVEISAVEQLQGEPWDDVTLPALLERLGPLPPLPPDAAELKKAKARKARPRPSRG